MPKPCGGVSRVTTTKMQKAHYVEGTKRKPPSYEVTRKENEVLGEEKSTSKIIFGI